MRFFMGLTLSIFLGISVGHTATLEIPGSGSTQSGIGVISGWKCQANGQLTVRFNGGRSLPLSYRSERGDTRSACGDSENGFVAIWNWGVLGDGRHTAVVYDNGIEFDRATFTVVTPGVDFLRGVSGSGTATLSNGQRVTLQWSEGSQSFVATDFTGTAPPPPEEWRGPIPGDLAIRESPYHTNLSVSPRGTVSGGCV